MLLPKDFRTKLEAVVGPSNRSLSQSRPQRRDFYFRQLADDFLKYLCYNKSEQRLKKFMTLKQLIAIIVLATLACWGAWTAVLFQVDPLESGTSGIIVFYGCLFLALLGTFFLISFGWRKIFSRYALDYKIVATSFRQSFFFSLIVVAIMFLQSKGLLAWWNIILIILAATLTEAFLLSLKKR